MCYCNTSSKPVSWKHWKVSHRLQFQPIIGANNSLNSKLAKADTICKQQLSFQQNQVTGSKQEAFDSEP